MAGQLMDRHPLIIGGGLLAPVARRWRTQIAEVAKAIAQFEELPEADHNMVAGVGQPDELITRTMAVFLRASLDSPRLAARVEATRQVLMVEGFNTDVIEAAGATRLAQQWTCLHYGDYVAYYLAMSYAVDPTPVAAIEDLKRRLRG
jgi:glucose/mannose-6-phosphate isomerase